MLWRAASVACLKVGHLHARAGRGEVGVLPVWFSAWLPPPAHGTTAFPSAGVQEAFGDQRGGIGNIDSLDLVTVGHFLLITAMWAGTDCTRHFNGEHPCASVLEQSLSQMRTKLSP